MPVRRRTPRCVPATRPYSPVVTSTDAHRLQQKALQRTAQPAPQQQHERQRQPRPRASSRSSRRHTPPQPTRPPPRRATALCLILCSSLHRLLTDCSLPHTLPQPTRPPLHRATALCLGSASIHPTRLQVVGARNLCDAQLAQLQLSLPVGTSSAVSSAQLNFHLAPGMATGSLALSERGPCQAIRAKTPPSGKEGRGAGVDKTSAGACLRVRERPADLAGRDGSVRCGPPVSLRNTQPTALLVICEGPRLEGYMLTLSRARSVGSVCPPKAPPSYIADAV